MIALLLPLAAVGGLLRWFAAEHLNRLGSVPLGTLAANLVSSLAVGLLTGLDGDRDLVVRVGLLGTLSTWSTLAFELTTMGRSGRPKAAVGYALASLVGGIGLAWLGLRLASS